MFDNAFKSIQAKHHIDLPFVLSTILSALALFGLGAAKSRFTGQKWFVSGLGVLGVGGFAAGLAFLVGYIVPLIFPDAKGMV